MCLYYGIIVCNCLFLLKKIQIIDKTTMFKLIDAALDILHGNYDLD